MSTPSERALKAVKASGLDESPITSLERDDALFALTNGTLVYQDGGGTRRVTLRDLTRIHSDQEGMLRVETPAGTALTASLLGFDPGDVQAFFGQVRNTTAQAKSMPASPLPTPAGGKTFSSAPITSAPVEEPKISTAPRQPFSTPPAPEAVVPGNDSAAAPEVPPAEAKASEASPPAEIIPPRPAPSPAPAKEPLIITASGGSPSATRPAPATPKPEQQPAPVIAKPEPAPVEAKPAELKPEPQPEPKPTSTPEFPSEVKTVSLLTPVAEPPALAAPRAVLGAAGSALAAEATSISGLVSRLRLLGGVLFVAAVALAYFQFTGDQRLNALWTLLAGGVGSIALLALADLARLLVSLAHAVSGESDAA